MRLRRDGAELQLEVGDEVGEGLAEHVGEIERRVAGEPGLGAGADAAVVGDRTGGGVRGAAVLRRRPLVDGAQLEEVAQRQLHAAGDRHVEGVEDGEVERVRLGDRVGCAEVLDLHAGQFGDGVEVRPEDLAAEESRGRTGLVTLGCRCRNQPCTDGDYRGYSGCQERSRYPAPAMSFPGSHSCSPCGRGRCLRAVRVERAEQRARPRSRTGLLTVRYYCPDKAIDLQN